MKKNKKYFIIGLVVALVSIIIMLSIFLYQELTKEPTIDNTGATFEDMVFQQVHNSEININEDAYDTPSDIYTKGFRIWQTHILNGEPLTLKKVKIVLPDKQVAYLKEYPYNQSILIAYANEEGTDFYIPHKFREEIEGWCSQFSYGNREEEMGEPHLLGSHYSEREGCIMPDLWFLNGK